MKGKFGGVMLVLVFLALVANLVFVGVSGESPVGRQAAYVIVFAALVLANLGLVGAGIYFVTRTHQKREKASLIWARRAFMACGVETVLLGLAPWFFYPETNLALPERMFNISLVLLLTGVTIGLFAFSCYREYVRAVGNRGARPEARRVRKEKHGR